MRLCCRKTAISLAWSVTQHTKVADTVGRFDRLQHELQVHDQGTRGLHLYALNLSLLENNVSQDHWYVVAGIRGEGKSTCRRMISLAMSETIMSAAGSYEMETQWFLVPGQYCTLGRSSKSHSPPCHRNRTRTISSSSTEKENRPKTQPR